MLKCLELKTIVICLKICAMWRFKSFLCVSGSFKHKVVQIWFVLHESWYIPEIGIYYFGEMVRIENNSYNL